MARTRGFAISVDDQRFVTNTTSASVVSESAELFVAAPVIRTVVYPGDDTAANTVGGQTIQLTGNNFRTGVQVYVNGNAVPSVTYNSSSNVVFTTPALGAATYPIYLVNADGSVAIFVPGLQVSGEPTWSTSATLPEQGVDDTWSISLSTTSDSSVTYALADGSTLPSGISLAANGLISGTFSSPPTEETTYNFTVIATDSENQDASRSFSINITVADEYFKDTVLLLHGDGTNNQNNHTFLDSSNNNYTITRYGNSTQGSFSPFSQTGWSIVFENTINEQSTSGKYLSIANTAAFNIGTGDFTLEGWIYPFQLPSSDSWPTNWWQHSLLFGRGTPNSGDGYNLMLGATKLIFQNNDGQVTNGTHNITPYNWYHVAASRSGGTLKLFVNGSEVATTSTSFTGGGGSNFYIGVETGQGGYFNGYMSNIRLVVGSGLYTETFTPSTTPLTAISNTVLLVAQSNDFVDNSTNGYTVNRPNNPTLQIFSPFAPTQKYSVANVGGSIYLDGTGDYLTCSPTPATFGSNNFTIETWAWFANNAVGYNPILSGYVSGDGRGWTITTETDNTLHFYGSNGSSWAYIIDTNTIPSINRWTHLALVRNGSTLTFYIDGVASGSNTAISTNALDTPTTFSVGYYPYYPGGARSFKGGYISGTRLVNGTALYTTNFSRPTAPPTNVANTSLLLNYTNAGIFDQTSKNILETVGDAKVSTTQYKYGTGSIYFDGSGDYLRFPATQFTSFGTGDYTIEFWLYWIASDFTIFDNQGSGGASQISKIGSALYHGTATPWTYTFTQNTWKHYAFSRSGSNLRFFVDGVLIETQTSTGVVGSAANINTIGMRNDGFYMLNGYIDDLRITKGVARYTSNFTPPTSAFRDR